MDPATLLSLAGSLKGLGGGGGSKSQSSSSNSLAVNTTANVGVNPLFAISSGAPLSDLTAGTAGISGAGSATSSSASSPSQSDGSGSAFPYTTGYPAVNDIDQPVSGGLFGGISDLFASPLMLAGLALGAYLLIQEGKGKK